MSLFQNLKRRKDAAEAARRPAFGIVGTPGPAAAAPAAPAAEPPRRTIQPAEYGLPPRDQIRTDLAYEDPERDALLGHAKAGNWRAVSAAFEAVGPAWERRYQLVQALGGHAVDDADWLDQWLAAEPANPTALVLNQRAISVLAGRLRGGGWAKDLTQEQIQGFHRVISQVPEAFQRSIAASAPEDPTPYIAMITTASDLGWSHDELRELWADVTKRAPYHVEAHLSAMMNWLPRWGGSTELVTAFVDEAAHGSPVGSLLTMPRLEMLYLENSLLRGEERVQAYGSPAVAAAIEEALADLAAADPAHPRYGTQLHWLAYFLTKAGRFAEAVDFFRRIGPYCGSWPWSNFNDPLAQFTGVRAEAVLGWEDAGRPPLPGQQD